MKHAKSKCTSVKKLMKVSSEKKEDLFFIPGKCGRWFKVTKTKKRDETTGEFILDNNEDYIAGELLDQSFQNDGSLLG